MYHLIKTEDATLSLYTNFQARSSYWKILPHHSRIHVTSNATSQRTCCACKVFRGPSKGSCSLLSLPECQIAILDDFRPDPQVVDVQTLLCSFEGGTVTISRPLNTYASHLQFTPDQPHFLTCNWNALYTPRGRMTESELSMLSDSAHNLCVQAHHSQCERCPLLPKVFCTMGDLRWKRHSKICGGWFSMRAPCHPINQWWWW